MNATLPRQGSTDPRAHLAELPDDAYVTAAEIATIASCSVRTWDRLVKAGKAPQPAPTLGWLVRRWRLGDIRAWLRSTPLGT